MSVTLMIKLVKCETCYCAVLSCGTVNYAVQGGPNFKSVDETLVYDHSNESY